MEQHHQQHPLQQQPVVQQQQQQQQQQYQQGGTVYIAGPGGQMYPVSQIPMAGYVAIPPPMQQNFAHSYKAGQSVYLGATLVVIGALAIIFNVAAMMTGDNVAVIGHGIWCGALFVVTGGFGIGAKKKNRCMIITFLVLCIVSAAFTICLLGLAIPQALVNATCYRPHDDDYRYYYHRCSTTGPVMGALLAVLAFLAAVAAIWGSAISCCAVCCCAPTMNTEMIAHYSHQQVMLISPQGTQLGGQQVPIQMVTSPAQPAVFGPSGYYQPPLPQQQTWIPPAEQPLQAGGSQEVARPSAPMGAFSQFDANQSPPPYSLPEKK